MRTEVIDALGTDSVLNGFGVDSDRIFSNYSIHGQIQVPKTGKFLVLRWETNRVQMNSSDGARGPKILTLWAHQSRNDGTSFLVLIDVLEQVEKVLCALPDSVDGITSVRYTGSSGDFPDEAYNTVTRNAAFEILGKS